MTRSLLPGALTLALLVPSSAPAGPPEPMAGAVERPEVSAEGLQAAVGDCPIAASHVSDRDGAERRKQAGRMAPLAPSHPIALAALGDPGKSVDGGGIKDVQRRIPRVNFIDDEIFSAMDTGRVRPAPLSSDAEFLRRVTLDLTGRIPDAAAVTAFLADTAADKRAKLVDQLLASDAFVDRWALYLGDLFKCTANADNGGLFVLGRNKYHAYFQDAIRSRKPYDLLARELIAGVGDSSVAGNANFAVRNIQNNGPRQDTLDNLASSVGSTFLGNQTFCTSCHDGSGHTDQINLWLSTVKRSDFWGMAAFFARSQSRRQGTDGASYYFTVSDAPTGEYQLNTTTGNKSPRDGKIWANGATVIYPKYLGGGAPQAGESYRAAMARLVTADPQFARATANYLWKEMFGVGIVEPADNFDMLRQNPSDDPPDGWSIQPTHPALLNRLGTEFAKGYDLRSILRTMAVSSAYQLSSFYAGEWKDEYARYFARHFPRRLRSEELLDAVTKATNVPVSLPVGGYTAPVPYAGQLPDVLEPGGNRGAGSPRVFLDAFLRGDRDSEPRSNDFSVTQALTLMNNALVTDRIKNSASGSSVNKLITAKATPETTVKTLYLNTLSRQPSASELATAMALFTNLKTGQTVTTVTEDLQHALLNKLDFLLNY